MKPLSVMILTQNNEISIQRCIDSVLWADEIVILDGGSSDRTLSILHEYEKKSSKIKVKKNAFLNFRDQRNFALTQCSHDWVFVLDSDERCTEELQKKIREILSRGNPEYLAYKIKRKEYFLGKEIHYGIWNPSYQDRLFLKHGVQYRNEVHEYPTYPSRFGEIHEAIEHWPYVTLEQFFDKMNRYTTVEAKDRFEKGIRTNAFHMLFAFPAMVWKNYFYYRAYRDGFEGFVISLMEGVSRAVRHIKIWKLMKESKKK